MEGGKHLLLLFSVLMFLKGSHQKPQVSKMRSLTDIFIGDMLYLQCDNSSSGDQVKWYFKNKYEPSMTPLYKIPIATSSHAGNYECEINGEKSAPLEISVLEYEPKATLTIKTGHPVMQTGSSVILNLQNDEGLDGWRCWVYRGDKVKRIVLKNTNVKSLDFQSYKLEVPETTYWCTNREMNIRSNQITVRTSGNQVALEMYPLPAIAGESLTLRCLTWGTDKIETAEFYKDNAIITPVNKDKYEVTHVTEEVKGKYRCHARFKYVEDATGPLYEVDSDVQDIPVLALPMKAVLTEDMSCSCEQCPDGDTHFYMKNDHSWTHVGSNTDNEGTYACRMVWYNGRSPLSNAVKNVPQQNSILPLVVVFVFIVLIVVVVLLIIWYKKRNSTGPVYEDVVRFQGKPDPEAARKKQEGEYEPLKTGEMKEGEYQTLEMAGAASGDGGYQALKKEGMKEGVYNTLEAQGAAGGDGGYEALKKEGMKEGVYHSLETQAAAGGDGGYEAVGKDK